ncbi:MAG: hypothetical protein ACI4S3_04650 [Candidatus Gastranaerophilaceae bacterium]
MNPYNSNDVKNVSLNKINNVTSPIKSTNNEDIVINMPSDSGVKSIELDDFFEFLDSKTVQKIMETPTDSKSRIMRDVAQMEYETDGAQAILNSLG